jgi:hypothetical protein
MTTEPTKRADGTCSACIGGWQCKYHQEQGVQADNRKAKILAEVCQNAKEIRIARYAAEMQLESDESGTAHEKAERALLSF